MFTLKIHIYTRTLGFFFVPNIDYEYAIYVNNNVNNNNSKTIKELLLGFNYYTNCICTISNKKQPIHTSKSMAQCLTISENTILIE